MAEYLPSSSFCFIMDLDFVSVNKNASSLRLLEVNMNVENPPSSFHQVISGSLIIGKRLPSRLSYRLTDLYFCNSNYLTKFFKNGVITSYEITACTNLRLNLTSSASFCQF